MDVLFVEERVVPQLLERRASLLRSVHDLETLQYDRIREMKHEEHTLFRNLRKSGGTLLRSSPRNSSTVPDNVLAIAI